MTPGSSTAPTPPAFWSRSRRSWRRPTSRVTWAWNGSSAMADRSTGGLSLRSLSPPDPPLWLVRAGTVPYRRAWAWQRALVERRVAGDICDTVLLLEHPHVYTIGKRGSDTDVLADAAWLTANGAEVVRSDRGGQVTYHGPGQLVGYPI